ncbi:hypothetical protein GCM10027321_31160 [Massilia terrae]
MLERDTVRTRGMQAQSRFGWYVSGSVLAVFLVSLLVWLARESPKVQQVEAVLAAADTDRPPAASTAGDSGLADEAPAMSHAPTAPAAQAAPASPAGPDSANLATLPSAAPPAHRTNVATQHAAIVDEQHPSSRKQDAQQHLPPIVLATPGLLGAVPPAQPTSGAVVQDETTATPPKPDAAIAQAMPLDEHKLPATPPPAPAPALKDDATSQAPAASGQAAPDPASAAPSVNQQQPATQAGADTPRSPASAKARSAARTRASARNKPRKPARNAGKAKRTAAQPHDAQTHDRQTDSDVALISAVIQHASTHPACAEAGCAAKATPKQ